MLRINSFGGLSVERDGRPLTGAAAQPRRMAILALLARADERGVTRDRVMSLLWPDMDEERARRALTQALYALRQDLGDDEAIAGVKELRLDLERISTDLHEFRRAKSRESLDDAAAAYRGPFLDGFHLPGADEFERWADQERRGLAREYAELVERLAFLAEKRGDFSTAVGWWRRLAAVDPLSALVAVSLMRALAAAGDAHGAIQHARVYEALLAQELDLPGDREVVALAAQLRREARRQSTESQASALNEAVEAEQAAETVAVSEPAVAQALVAQLPSSDAAAGSTVLPVQTTTSRRERRWRRSWLITGAIAGAVGLSIVVRLSMSTVAPGDQPVVVVGRIADYSGEPTRSLGSPIGDMLATNLARAPGLRVVSSARMYELLGRMASSSRDTTLSVVIAAARLAGATDLIDGAIHRVGEGKLRLDIQRVDVSSGAVIRAYTVVGGDLFALADSGSLRLVRHLGTTLPSGSLADVTTRSAVAYQLYAEGLRAYSTGERERADSLFVAALNEDSTFAMATYYHSTLTRDPIPALARAVALSASASERERLIIRSEWAYANSSPSILAYAESLAVRYPAELEGHLHVGRAYVNLGRFLESVPLLQRVVDMDSASLSGRTIACSACAALSWMLGAYLHADSVTAAERVARRWVAVQGGSPSPWRSLGAVLEIQGRWSEASEAYAVVTRFDSRNADAWEIQVPILLRRGELAAAERLAAQHVAGTPFGSAWWTVIARRYAGRFQDAIDEARKGLATVGPNESPSGMLLLLGQALLEGGKYPEAIAAFDSFVRKPDPRLEFSNFARYRAFVLTHISNALAAAGDTARLAAIADSVQALGAQSSYGRDRRLFHHLRGLLLRARGDLSAAADEFRAAIWTPTFRYTRSNLELAKTLLALNRPREAVATLQPSLRGSVEASNLYVTHTDLHEQLGRAWEAAGSMDSAAVHYEYVARAWEYGDPPFAKRSAEARAKLGALRQTAR